MSAIRNFRCVRTATHKLIDNYSDVRELYNLEEDPDELKNIAGECPDVARAMVAKTGWPHATD